MFKLGPVKLDIGKNLKAPLTERKKEETIDFGPTPVFHSTEIQGKNLSESFFYDEDKWMTVHDGSGKQEYFSLKGTKRNAVKWGQLKLFITELSFFNKYWNPQQIPNPLCVYVGAADGHHIHFLAKMFPAITFHLYDGRPFDPKLNTLPNVKTFVQLFMEEDAKKYASRNDVYFISDIRSLEYNTLNEVGEAVERINESITDKDMKLQMEWVNIIKPVKAHLKFRLPYDYKWNTNKSYTYFDGEVYKQAFAPITSSETRLIVDMDSPLREWNFRAYDQHMFYHNNIIREHIKFVNPLNNMVGPISPELGLLEDYDSVIFATQVKEYLIKFGIDNPTANQVLLLCEEIMKDVSSGRYTLASIRTGKTMVSEFQEE